MANKQAFSCIFQTRADSNIRHHNDVFDKNDVQGTALEPYGESLVLVDAFEMKDDPPRAGIHIDAVQSLTSHSRLPDS